MMTRKILTLALLLFFTQCCCGQGKEVIIPTYKNGDTSLSYLWQQEKIAKLKLPNLIKSKDSLHFRLSTEIFAIDIWTQDFKIFHGTFLNFTKRSSDESYDPKKEKRKKLYRTKTQLDTAIARKVYNLFNDRSIFTIPRDEEIKGWQMGNDGIEYLIEYATPTYYSFKTYWTPSYYKDKIKEAAIITDLIGQLETTLHMRKAFDSFIHSLPPHCYYAGGIMITCPPIRKRK